MINYVCRRQKGAQALIFPMQFRGKQPYNGDRSQTGGLKRMNRIENPGYYTAVFGIKIVIRKNDR